MAQKIYIQYIQKIPQFSKIYERGGEGGEDNNSNVYTVQCTMFIPTMLTHFESQKCQKYTCL